MRPDRKILAGLLVVASLFTASVGSIPASQAAVSQQQQDDLRARRAELFAQLQTLLASERGSATNLAASEGQYLDAQTALTSVRTDLNDANQRLEQLQQQISAEQKRDLDAQRQLAILVRATYESAGDRSLLANMLSSHDFGEAMARAKSADSFQNQVVQLQAQLTADQTALAKQRAELQTKFAQASTLERQLSDQSNRFLAAVQTRNMSLANASAPVRALEAQIADIDNQLAGDNLPTVNGRSSCGNQFAYGQCTWYVATRRCIPWSGNANQWFSNAAAMGYLEGHRPAVGAVVAFWPGGDGAGSVGHVGYVEQVGPDGGVPPGYFRLSEMNYGGWGFVNYRVLPNNSAGIQGFIYGHS